MPSERVQRRIDRLLDQAEEAAENFEWDRVHEAATSVLAVDPENEDAPSFLAMAAPHLSNQAPIGTSSDHSAVENSVSPSDTASTDSSTNLLASAQPTSFASGRYTVSKFLGEGGKKKVYLAHDNTLDRDVAFALIKTEGLDETGRERVRREAQAMGRMGTHPCIMPIYDLGEENGQPFMVQPLMSGGDVEGLVEDAEGPLALDRALEIATQTAQGLSFAHSKGIVHRDLKPGNVWMDEDGAAKIGDFGLAVATDRSRLTVEKVMVGTVSYMPPEQATGGEVTPRADLYSLGAMLYEMCTGRVPFMGDDDIGIISQHINTPPVAPSWHNNQIPKTLDSLILRLLSKDPAERPSDADEVLAALKSVDLTAVEEREDGAGSLDSMAGGVFVGRHREMDQLKSIFEDVLSGKGRMVTLVGEPGIGKTRTAQELATYAGMRGASVLWGRSYEGGGAPPYWPWVQVIRSHVANVEPDDLRRLLGATAPVIAEVVPEVKTALPDAQPPPAIENPESARFRLFDSISTFLKNISSSTPLVLMLEDLHWSDKPSLMLLEFVARELANSRILIVGNYRDMELNRRHPLSVTLGDLTRERLFERVVLRGLQRHDVQRFIEIAAGIAPPAALVDAVHSQTEGNPLFVTETVRLLIQEGDISSGQTTSSGTTTWEIRIPEGVREVIGRRLDRLSERCNEILTIAAVIGRQFRFDVLKMMMENTTENQLLDAMDEALSARIIEELPDEVGFYQFTHAQMQETLVSELSHTRSVRMHAQIAEALEDFYGEEAEEHAAELVEHFAEAETVLGTGRLVKYCLAAGEGAAANFANESSAELFRAGLNALAGDAMSDDKARLMAGLAASLSFISTRGEIQEAIELSEAAFSYFESLGRHDEALAAVVIELSTNVGVGTGGTYELLQRALNIVDPKSLQAGRLYAQIGRSAGLELSKWEEAWDAFDHALAIAQKHRDKGLELRTLANFANTAGLGGDFARWEQLLARGLELAATVDEPKAQAMIYVCAAMRSLSLVKDDNALKYAITGTESAQRHRINEWTSIGHTFVSWAYGRSGDIPNGIEQLEIAQGLSPNDARPINGLVSYRSQIGDIEKAQNHLERLRSLADNLPIGSLESVSVAQAIAEVLLLDGYREWLTYGLTIINKIMNVKPLNIMYHHNATIARAAMLLASGDREAAEQDYLLYLDQGGEYGIGYTPFGNLHSLYVRSELHDPASNIDYLSGFIERLRAAKGMAAIPWILYFSSENHLRRNLPGDREKAIELQDEAISIATELGMKPLLERVLAKRKILKA